MSVYNVKQATIDDLEHLAPLFDAYRVFYGRESNLEGAKQFLFERFEHQESIIFVVQHENEYVGFAQLYPTFSSISMKRMWTLNDLYVVGHHRGQGIATMLLDSVKAYAIQTKAKGLSLSTATSNERAQRLYERYGFVKDNSYYYYDLNV